MRSVGHRGMTYATSARLCKKIPPQHVCLLVFLEGGLLARRRLTPGVPPSGAGGVVDSVLAAPLRVAGSSSLEGSSPQSSPVPRGESGRFGSGGVWLAQRRLTPGVPPSGAGGVVDSVLAASLRIAGSSSLEGSSPRSSPVPSRGSGSFWYRAAGLPWGAFPSGSPRGGAK